MTKRIRLEQGEARVGFTESEMREVIGDKSEHNQPAHHHVARGKRCFDVAFVDIGFGTGTPVFNCQLDSHPDVNNDDGEEKNPDQPKERPEVVEMLGVTIGPIRSDKYLQIPEQMSDHKKDQNDAGDRDDHFLPDRRTIKTC